MKKLINFTLIVAMALLVAACHKNSAVTRMAPISFKTSLQSSASSVKLTAATDSTNVVTFTWPAVIYPAKGQVTYKLHADVPSDTVGATAWGKDTSILIGKDVLTTTLRGSVLNQLAVSRGIKGGDTAKMVFRIESYQDRSAFSGAVTVIVSPYSAEIVLPPTPTPPASLGYPTLWLPGFYQGWSPGTAGTVAAAKTGIYEGYIYMPVSSDPAAYHFKFTSAPDWGHTNYGDAGGGKLSTDGGAGDLVLPGPGFYELSANTTTLTWTATPTTWAIIGDATPNGWNTETKMAYDAKRNLWYIKLAMIKNGSFKFRANNAWNLDFGIDANGHLQYADSPIYGYTGGLGNLTVPEDGTYIICLDLHDPNAYTYFVQKQ